MNGAKAATNSKAVITDTDPADTVRLKVSVSTADIMATSPETVPKTADAVTVAEGLTEERIHTIPDTEEGDLTAALLLPVSAPRPVTVDTEEDIAEELPATPEVEATATAETNEEVIPANPETNPRNLRMTKKTTKKAKKVRLLKKVLKKSNLNKDLN